MSCFESAFMLVVNSSCRNAISCKWRARFRQKYARENVNAILIIRHTVLLIVCEITSLVLVEQIIFVWFMCNIIQTIRFL